MGINYDDEDDDDDNYVDDDDDDDNDDNDKDVFCQKHFFSRMIMLEALLE